MMNIKKVQPYDSKYNPEPGIVYTTGDDIYITDGAEFIVLHGSVLINHIAELQTGSYKIADEYTITILPDSTLYFKHVAEPKPVYDEPEILPEVGEHVPPEHAYLEAMFTQFAVKNGLIRKSETSTTPLDENLDEFDDSDYDKFEELYPIDEFTLVREPENIDMIPDAVEETPPTTGDIQNEPDPLVTEEVEPANPA